MTAPKLQTYESLFEQRVVPFMKGAGFEWLGWQNYRAARLALFRREGIEVLVTVEVFEGMYTSVWFQHASPAAKEPMNRGGANARTLIDALVKKGQLSAQDADAEQYSVEFLESRIDSALGRLRLCVEHGPAVEEALQENEQRWRDMAAQWAERGAKRRIAQSSPPTASSLPPWRTFLLRLLILAATLFVTVLAIAGAIALGVRLFGH